MHLLISLLSVLPTTVEVCMQSQMSESAIKDFYKAAHRTGFKANIPPSLEGEIAKEEQEAPLPSACTPRSRARGHVELPPDTGKCTGGVCWKSVASGEAEQVCLTGRVGEALQSGINPESLAHKYFTPQQIQALKMARLQAVAENDRQKVMTILNPVVSLLDGLELSNSKDQAVVSDIKAKLSRIGGNNTEFHSRSNSSNAQHPPTPQGFTVNTVSGPLRTSAIRLLPQEENSKPTVRFDAEEPESEESVDEVVRNSGACGGVFETWIQRVLDFWHQRDGHEEEEEEQPMQMYHIPVVEAPTKKKLPTPQRITDHVTPSGRHMFRKGGLTHAVLDDMSPRVMPHVGPSWVTQRIPF
eukprot:Blabericola_migrator_1__1955@NODE_1532_length_4334_cov_107_653386_g1006_i0_p2_GENE_NODE_1532_length_4334_cov_107_653386_g1006_i0NODE_1532_length_4334_cov_107_653386_g1006_i0_p2_ORF_typecomplete_len356_score66_15_NODE_1532_length_4334_cov_107_653386_g1006_i026443711